jgi:hypothetical protein
MNKEFIVHCVSIPHDVNDRFYLDFHVYNVKFLPDSNVLGCLPDGEGRELVWRGIFMAFKVPQPTV